MLIQIIMRKIKKIGKISLIQIASENCFTNYKFYKKKYWLKILLKLQILLNHGILLFAKLKVSHIYITFLIHFHLKTSFRCSI